MLLKYTLKNMLTHPIRLIVLLICVTAASFAAFLALDVSNAIYKLLDYSMTTYVGDADLYVSFNGEGGITDEMFSGCPGSNIVMTGFGGKREVRRDEKLYNYALTDNVAIYAFAELEKAQKMGIIKEKYTLADDEIAISEKYSKDYGYSVGDKITLYDYKGDEFDLTVTHVFGNEKGFLASDEYCAVMTTEPAFRQNGVDWYQMAFVDVLNDDIDGFKAALKENEPNAEVEVMLMDEEMQNMIDNVVAIMYLVFILVFILVVFVTVSFAEKIVTERMSVIGTLRSIGVSRRRTTFILLAENILYGLVGALLGIWLGKLVRPSLFQVTEIEDYSEVRAIMGSVKPSTYIIIILGMVLLETLVPLIELTKAVKTPIRDIIFENRDTEYRVSVPKTIAGTVLLAAGLIIGFTSHTPIVMISAVLMIVLGAALAVQFVVRLISRVLSNLFGRLKCPVAELAALEAGSKKSNMGNSMLAVAAITAAAAIFVIGNSLLYWTEQTAYDTDVHVSASGGLKTEEYEFISDIEAVDEVEFIYKEYDDIKVGDKTGEWWEIYSLPEGDQLLGITGLPETLGRNEFVMDKSLADKLGMKIGDTRTVTFGVNNFFPQDKEMTLVGYINSLAAAEGGAIVLEPTMYRTLYRDTPSEILVRTSDAEGIAQKLKNSLTSGETIETAAEMQLNKEKSSKGTRMALILAVAAAMGMTMIGIFGNQVIGFEGRRKEFALLHSTAMPRRKIRRLILIENAVSFGISTVIAALCCVPVITLVGRIFVETDSGIIVIARYGLLLKCLAVLWIVVTLTALSPMIRLRRMNTANEIKYE